MLHQIFIGILFGWGIAIPIGPINLEIVRRNLQQGILNATLFGLGACSADVTYLFLFAFSAIQILRDPLLLQIVSVLGAFILFWFGISALRSKPTFHDSDAHLPLKHSKSRSAIQNFISGYLMTLVSPMTLLFWSSMGAQIALISERAAVKPWFFTVGVIIGTVSWDLSLNIFVHVTKHRLSQRVSKILNDIGGVILLGFAGYCLFHAF